MTCQRCASSHIVDVLAKVLPPDVKEYYIEDDTKDFIEFEVCLDCGQIQGSYPYLPGTF